MVSGDPIGIFVTHAWQESDDYLRVFEFLEGARNFRYANCSDPLRRPAIGGQEAEREELRRQIQRSEVVIGLGGLMASDLALLRFQLVYAKSLDKPVLLLPNFGQALREIPEFKGLVDETLQWDERAMVDALRREARQESANRYDVIEFKLD